MRLTQLNCGPKQFCLSQESVMQTISRLGRPLMTMSDGFSMPPQPPWTPGTKRKTLIQTRVNWYQMFQIVFFLSLNKWHSQTAQSHGMFFLCLWCLSDCPWRIFSLLRQGKNWIIAERLGTDLNTDTWMHDCYLQIKLELASTSWTLLEPICCLLKSQILLKWYSIREIPVFFAASVSHSHADMESVLHRYRES